MYRLRCTVSGGLEDFAEAEFSQIFSNNDGVRWAWHHRGHSGSLLDLFCDLSGEVLLSNATPRLLQSLHFVDHVSMLVLSEDVPKKDPITANWITEKCLQLKRETLDTAIEAWERWKPVLENAMSRTVELEGELIATPTKNEGEQERPQSILTDSFQVNTIYTKIHVAKMVVGVFLQLVGKELPAEDEIMWVDAGAGSGALLQQLPSDTSIGVDLDPRHPSVHQYDFLKISKEWLESLQPNYQTLCIISNPPFVQGSRGDYGIIAAFLEHALKLGCSFFGLIVPQKFAHVWKSYSLPIQLRYRMHLPKDSFYDPSTAESKHINCYLLIFDLKPTPCNEEPTPQRNSGTPHTIHVVAQRDKGLFPNISTAEFTSAVVHGLGRRGVPLGSSKSSAITMRAKLGTNLELFLDLNPKRPLSVVNSVSRYVERHSLGWMSKSVKPPVALAMNYLSQFGAVPTAGPGQVPIERVNQPCVTINLLCGEGTLEYEAMNYPTGGRPSFHIVGDKNLDAIHQVKAQLAALPLQAPPMDFVLWDAQNLPLRRGVADSVLADLPFTGSKVKKHQEPSTTHAPKSPPPFSYPEVLASTVRVLAPATGRAILVSADGKALTHGIWKFSGHLKEIWQTKLNIGGIAGRLSLVVRKDGSWKDLNLLMDDAGGDKSMEILTRARKACTCFHVDKLLELKETRETTSRSLLASVQHLNEYRHQDHSVCHGYRLHFDPLVTNTQAKILEKLIRLRLEEQPIQGTRLQ